MVKVLLSPIPPAVPATAGPPAVAPGGATTTTAAAAAAPAATAATAFIGANLGYLEADASVVVCEERRAKRLSLGWVASRFYAAHRDAAWNLAGLSSGQALFRCRYALDARRVPGGRLLGTDLRLNKRVAFVPPPPGRDRLRAVVGLHEALAEAAADTSVVQLLDFWAATTAADGGGGGGGGFVDGPCLVLEHPSHTLWDLLNDGGAAAVVSGGGGGGGGGGLSVGRPLDGATVLAVAEGLCRATRALHAAGFVHAAVRPRSVGWFGCRGGWRLLESEGCRQAGEKMPLVFSPGYCPPEMARKRRVGGPLTAAAAYDMWCVGVVVLEAATGQKLFGDEVGGGEVALALLSQDDAADLRKLVARRLAALQQQGGAAPSAAAAAIVRLLNSVLRPFPDERATADACCQLLSLADQDGTGGGTTQAAAAATAATITTTPASSAVADATTTTSTEVTTAAAAAEPPPPEKTVSSVSDMRPFPASVPRGVEPVVLREADAGGGGAGRLFGTTEPLTSQITAAAASAGAPADVVVLADFDAPSSVATLRAYTSRDMQYHGRLPTNAYDDAEVNWQFPMWAKGGGSGGGVSLRQGRQGDQPQPQPTAKRKLPRPRQRPNSAAAAVSAAASLPPQHQPADGVTVEWNVESPRQLLKTYPWVDLQRKMAEAAERPLQRPSEGAYANSISPFFSAWKHSGADYRPATAFYCRQKPRRLRRRRRVPGVPGCSDSDDEPPQPQPLPLSPLPRVTRVHRNEAAAAAAQLVQSAASATTASRTGDDNDCARALLRDARAPVASHGGGDSATAAAAAPSVAAKAAAQERCYCGRSVGGQQAQAALRSVDARILRPGGGVVDATLWALPPRRTLGPLPNGETPGWVRYADLILGVAEPPRCRQGHLLAERRVAVKEVRCGSCRRRCTCCTALYVCPMCALHFCRECAQAMHKEKGHAAPSAAKKTKPREEGRRVKLR